jgi:glycosyltransferase involved in cell wall biosynthesis
MSGAIEGPARPEPLVTVVVPVYQGERVIRGAVRSALGQTHRNLEVIVVDDGSRDRTLERLATIDDPRLIVIEQSNSGAGGARNAGLARARGDYVAFLDADDRWFPEKISTEIGLLLRTGDPAIAYSWYVAVDDAGRLLHHSRKAALEGPSFEAALEIEPFLLPSVSLYDRRVIEAVGPFGARRIHEDFEFNLRAAKAFPIYPTRRYLVVYRQSLQGKGRAVLADFGAARRAQMTIADDLRPLLDEAQMEKLRKTLIAGLYCRFLMYGFNQSARRLQRDLDLACLRGSKGLLARIFALTGVNALPLARGLVQNSNRMISQGAWEKRLKRARLRLVYE